MRWAGGKSSTSRRGGAFECEGQVTRSIRLGSSFLIVCTARTGSNLLVRSLARPPHVRCFGEVAKANFATESNAFAPFERLTGRDGEDLAKLQAEDISGFVFDVLYTLPGDAVGFKLFYEHCREPGRVQLWDELASHKALKVIHLTRNATFDLYLSLLYAQRTDKWLTRPDDPGALANDSEDIEVDVDHCRAFLQRHLDWRRETEARFGSHPYMEVDYGDLETDLPAALSKVRQFIGAPNLKENLVPLRKQAARRAYEKVRNYESVRAAFKGTSLARLFTEG